MLVQFDLKSPNILLAKDNTGDQSSSYHLNSPLLSACLVDVADVYKMQMECGSSACMYLKRTLLVGAAKIADVGLARFMNSDHVTQMSVMGTLAWAAPEVLR